VQRPYVQRLSLRESLGQPSIENRVIENDSVLSNNTSEQGYMNKTRTKDGEICPSSLTSKVKGRLEMVHTAEQSVDRRKLSTFHGIGFHGKRPAGVPES